MKTADACHAVYVWGYRVLAVVICAVCLSSVGVAQSRDRDKDRDKDRKEKPEVSSEELTSRITKAEESLMQEYLSVANEFYVQGDKQGSIDVLERVRRINPRADGVAQRIESIREELLQENGLKVDLDVSKNTWLPTFDVEADKAFRIAVAGDYKLDLTQQIAPGGISQSDPAKDAIAGAPFGAVIGVVVTDGKPGEPFAVSTGGEHTPKKSGTLFLRVNVPATAKCKGELKVQASGGVIPLAKRR